MPEIIQLTPGKGATAPRLGAACYELPLGSPLSALQGEDRERVHQLRITSALSAAASLSTWERAHREGNYKGPVSDLEEPVALRRSGSPHLILTRPPTH